MKNKRNSKHIWLQDEASLHFNQVFYTSRAPELTPGFGWVHVAQSVFFCVVF